MNNGPPMLQASDQFYQLLLENAPDVIMLLKANGTIKYINHTLPEYSIESVTGSCVLDYLSGDNQVRFQQAMETAFSKGISESVEISAVGPTYWRTRLFPIKGDDGSVQSVLSISTNITEHEQIERSLKESERRFRAIFETSSDGIVVIDLETLRAWDANHQMINMMGYSREELLRLTVPDFHPAEAWPSVSETFHRFRTGEISSAAEIPVKHKDGHVFFADITRGAMRLEGKEFLVGFFRDVTERKRAQQELKDSEARTAALLQQNRKLTQRMLKAQEEERTYLARELHDEFGQWLTALDSHAKVLGLRMKGQSDELHELSEAIVESTAHLYEGIRSMLRRLRPGTIVELGLAACVQELVSSWVSHHPEIQYRLTIDENLSGMEESLSITVYRIIQEALNNIARHAEATEVSIQLERVSEPPSLPDILKLRIKDNGKGPGESFDQEGVGLANMRERVLALEGQIEFGGSAGAGMQIDIRIPMPR